MVVESEYSFKVYILLIALIHKKQHRFKSKSLHCQKLYNGGNVLSRVSLMDSNATGQEAWRKVRSCLPWSIR